VSQDGNISQNSKGTIIIRSNAARLKQHGKPAAATVKQKVVDGEATFAPLSIYADGGPSKEDRLLDITITTSVPGIELSMPVQVKVHPHKGPSYIDLVFDSELNKSSERSKISWDKKSEQNKKAVLAGCANHFPSIGVVLRNELGLVLKKPPNHDFVLKCEELSVHTSGSIKQLMEGEGYAAADREKPMFLIPHSTNEEAGAPGNCAGTFAARITLEPVEPTSKDGAASAAGSKDSAHLAKDFAHLAKDFEIERVFSERVSQLWLATDGGEQLNNLEVVSGDKNEINLTLYVVDELERVQPLALCTARGTKYLCTNGVVKLEFQLQNPMKAKVEKQDAAGSGAVAAATAPMQPQRKPTHLQLRFLKIEWLEKELEDDEDNAATAAQVEKILLQARDSYQEQGAKVTVDLRYSTLEERLALRHLKKVRLELKVVEPADSKDEDVEKELQLCVKGIVQHEGQPVTRCGCSCYLISVSLVTLCDNTPGTSNGRWCPCRSCRSR
jgi:hypothetical protein